MPPSSNKFKGPLDYIDVATRIVDFREKHPEGSLQQVKWEIVEVAGRAFVVYTAAAYRTPDDTRPGVGTAWEPVPGPTRFTQDSELQNAETAAWGRAIVAALAADTKHGIASSEEVRARTEAENNPRQSSITMAVAQERVKHFIGGDVDKLRDFWREARDDGAEPGVLAFIADRAKAAQPEPAEGDVVDATEGPQNN